MSPVIKETTRLENPSFVKPLLIHYKQNDIHRTWEAVRSHDSVSILLYNIDLDSFVIVKQFRPPVLLNNETNGMMYELCAGIVDKKLSLQEIAKEEIHEECGYDVPLQMIEEITSFYTSVGISGAKQTLYYAQIDESMKVSEGGGLEEESIEVIHVKKEDAKEFILNPAYQKTPGLMVAFYWFFDKKS
ncbi:NUDIX domain-containing protein [Sulfurimonas sp. HSL3-2]|uniref:NUDIX domain-containing protein n=1 Tax=Hydrocurvibacter mobilis TaxID=3131936 RepID=UPI0031F93C17